MGHVQVDGAEPRAAECELAGDVISGEGDGLLAALDDVADLGGDEHIVPFAFLAPASYNAFALAAGETVGRVEHADADLIRLIEPLERLIGRHPQADARWGGPDSTDRSTAEEELAHANPGAPQVDLCHVCSLNCYHHGHLRKPH